MEDAGQFDANLAALRARQADVADLLASTPVPDTIVEAVGRDGGRTFHLRDAAGNHVWFGNSSMPTVSAAATAERVAADGRNLALAGVGTGLEALLIARQLRSHNAVFVLETDALQVALALRLYDYVEPLTLGRIVFIVGSDIESAFERFFQVNVGYEFPTALLPLPLPEPDAAVAFAVLQKRVESAGARVARMQAAEVQRVVQRLKEGPCPPSAAGMAPAEGTLPRFAVLSVDPRPAAVEQAGRIARALAPAMPAQCCGHGTPEWGAAYEVCVPDRPEQCHVLARLGTIDRGGANVVLFVGAPGAMAALLPPSLAVCSWFTAGAGAGDGLSRELPPHHRVFASCGELRDMLLRAGVPAGRIEMLGDGADTSVFRPAIGAGAGSTSCDVAVLCDLPANDAKSWGVVLPSHHALWEACFRAVGEDVDGYADDRAEVCLRRGEEISGTGLRDEAVRGQFLGLLRGVIAPIATARATVESLMGMGYRVGVWGAQWHGFSGAAEVRHGPTPRGEALCRVFHGAGAVVFPAAGAMTVQTALDALAAGAKVCCRRGLEPFRDAYPDLAAIEAYFHLFRTRGELAAHLHSSSLSMGPRVHGPMPPGRDLAAHLHTSSLTTDPRVHGPMPPGPVPPGTSILAGRGNDVTLASKIVAEHHSVSARLRALWEALRAGPRQEAGRAVVHA